MHSKLRINRQVASADFVLVPRMCKILLELMSFAFDLFDLTQQFRPHRLLWLYTVRKVAWIFTL